MKSSRNARLQAPRLPAELLPGRLNALDDEAEYAAVLLAECDLSKQSAGRVVFDQALVRHASLAGTRLLNMRMSDARLEASDLSGAVWQKARLYRVEFVGCRLTGIQLPEINGGDVLFKECTMESAMFTSGQIRPVRFERCNMRKVLFEKMDLAGGAFKECDLAGADFTGSTLKRADFRGSDLSGVRIEGRQLQGTIIDHVQAVQVAALMGIIVKEQGEQPTPVERNTR